MKKTQFDIYVASSNGSAKTTCAKFREVCGEYFGGDDKVEINVIDIIKNAGLAEKNKIIATPTIIRKSPQPGKRIIGELSDKESAERAIQYLTSDL